VCVLKKTKMSWIIDKTRGLLGFSTGDSTGTQTSSGISDEDKQKFVRAQKAKVNQLNQNLNKVLEEIPTLTDRKLLTFKLQERDRLKQQIVDIQAKISNVEGVELTIDSANSTLQTAKILKSANAKLDATVKESEKLDFDGILDVYKDNSRQTQEMSSRLAQPWIEPEDDEKINDEIEQLLNQRKKEEQDHLDVDLHLPSVPVKKTTTTRPEQQMMK